jgi:Fur family ferric uptake transcriptional regulator
MFTFLLKTVIIIIKGVVMPGHNHWRQKFRGHVSRLTAPRTAILDLLSHTSSHLSAKEIHASLYRSNPSLGLTTVYRTLDLLDQMNLIQKISLGDGQSRYEFKGGDKENHHHHLICSECGQIFNYTEFEDEELALIKKTEEKLKKKYNFKIFDHNIEFYGLCKKCRQHSTNKGGDSNARRR